MISMLVSGPSCLRFDSQHSQFFSDENIVEVAELKKGAHWLENVDQTHHVLAGTKLVMQKGQLIN